MEPVTQLLTRWRRTNSRWPSPILCPPRTGARHFQVANFKTDDFSHWSPSAILTRQVTTRTRTIMLCWRSKSERSDDTGERRMSKDLLGEFKFHRRTCFYKKSIVDLALVQEHVFNSNFGTPKNWNEHKTKIGKQKCGQTQPFRARRCCETNATVYRPRVKPFCEGPIPRVVAPGHLQRLSCQMGSGVSLFKASKPTNENGWRLVHEDSPICRAWRASGKWPHILLWTPIPSQFFSASFLVGIRVKKLFTAGLVNL